MDCLEAQERILGSFDTALSQLEKNDLERHISGCAKCTEFANLQSQLDLRLREQITVPRLSSGFRPAMLASVARQRREPWPEWLPDVAHLAGSGVALGVCVLLLPFPAPAIVGTGALMAGLAYLLQTVLLAALEYTE